MARDLQQEAQNKALVLEAFDALFNRRDFEAAERYWSPDYVQHSAGIGPGRDGLFALARSVHRQYESGLAIAEGHYVMVHGRLSGGGRPTRIVVDILRVDGQAASTETLGRHAGRSNRGQFEERLADVRRPVPG